MTPWFGREGMEKAVIAWTTSSCKRKSSNRAQPHSNGSMHILCNGREGSCSNNTAAAAAEQTHIMCVCDYVCLLFVCVILCVLCVCVLTVCADHSPLFASAHVLTHYIYIYIHYIGRDCCCC